MQSWLYHLNPFRYFMEGIIGNALGPLSIECSTEDFLKFSAPAGISFLQYIIYFYFPLKERVLIYSIRFDLWRIHSRVHANSTWILRQS